jgi:hypothetical protein
MAPHSAIRRHGEILDRMYALMRRRMKNAAGEEVEPEERERHQKVKLRLLRRQSRGQK